MIDIDKRDLRYAFEDFFIEFLRSLSRDDKKKTAILLAKELTIIIAKANHEDQGELSEILAQVMTKCLDASEEYLGEVGSLEHLQPIVAKRGPKVIAEKIAGGATQQARAEGRLFEAINSFNCEMSYRIGENRG